MAGDSGVGEAGVGGYVADARHKLADILGRDAAIVADSLSLAARVVDSFGRRNDRFVSDINQHREPGLKHLKVNDGLADCREQHVDANHADETRRADGVLRVDSFRHGYHPVSAAGILVRRREDRLAHAATAACAALLAFAQGAPVPAAHRRVVAVACPSSQLKSPIS